MAVANKMLLKQSNPEHATNSIGIDATTLEDDIHSSNNNNNGNNGNNNNIMHMDPLADVFGSDTGAEDDAFSSNDVFYDDNLDQHQHQDDSNHSHPSDIHRLQQEHVTAGYRDGITVAKASSIQAGFDEGFSLGATIGLKVGELLGVLEGVVAAVTGRAGSNSSSTGPGVVDVSTSPDSPEEMSKLLSQARTELSVRSVFGETYWHTDGTWKYEVNVNVDEKSASRNDEHEINSSDKGKDDSNSELLFSHVADAHPLVSKWTGIVHALVRKWGVDEQLPLLQRRADNDELEDTTMALVEPMAKATKSTTQGGAKAPSGALSW